MTISHVNVWDGSYKIPWNDPEFSRRMLAEHLTQEHDMASRRLVLIDQQVDFIHDRILNGEASAILDLGCGPGFYLHRLSQMAHHCVGIDFGPASIEFAAANSPNESRCEFILGDIREAELAGPYNLIMILFGELNAFSPSEADGILRNAQSSLTSNGRLIIELQTAYAVKDLGEGEASERTLESGLFSDEPHCCRTECHWSAEQAVSVQTFSITDVNSGQHRLYRSTTKAWSDDEFVELLTTAGFTKPSRLDAWPSHSEAFQLWAASR